MDIITMLATMLAIALSSLALGLCILFSIRTGVSWSKLLVAFLSVLVGAMTLLAVEHYTNFLLSVFGMQDTAKVVSIVLESIVSLCSCFLVLFIPFFVTMVLGTMRHEKLFWILLSTLAGCYLAAGVLNQIFSRPWMELVSSLIFLGVYFFSMTMLWINVSKIRDRNTRRIIVAANIVSLSLIPVFCLSLIFPDFQISSYALYCMAFSIVMIVYFYGSFTKEFREDSRQPKELALSDLKCYRISEREFSVIKLVAKGMTNKEIASELSISVNTVNNHVANVFSKTGVRSRIDLLNLLKEVNK